MEEENSPELTSFGSLFSDLQHSVSESFDIHS